ncbi:DUF2939 domain-containing protein [Sphingomonas soli]|uniref:DUF2939 domain-containing protein n=1 Tax=Sphingomonas soli TaxID=266127 RepID=UPI00082A5889|nr:DUF2939 domain-containing protein [Sphingomonas soli]
MKRILIAVALLAALAGGGWYWASPWWTVQTMKDAAEARDVDALSRRVDYESLRASLKAQLRARVENGRRDDGVLEALVAGGIADRLVDAALTPEAMRVIFAAAPLAAQPARGAVKLKASDMEMRRDGIDRFRLVRKDGKSGALIFRLRGMRWMLTGIELPAQGVG